MNKSFDSEGRQFAWDATSLSLAFECPRKYYYIMKEGWRRRGANPHLLFGGVYAKACEVYHKLRTDGADHEEALRAVVRLALCATWEYQIKHEDGNEYWVGGYEPQDVEMVELYGTGEGRPWESDHNLKTRANLIRTIIWYLEEFKDDSCKTIILDNGKPAVELSFSIPVDNDIILCGHLDRLVEYAGDPYITDQKTTGNTVTNKFFEDFSPDIQMSQYTFAGITAYHIPVKGVIIDAAQIAVGFTRFQRGFVFRDKASLAEWYDEVMHKIEEVRQMSLDNYFPKNPQACFNYGGCQFRGVCARSPAVRQQFLKGDFVQLPIWDPMEKR